MPIHGQAVRKKGRFNCCGIFNSHDDKKMKAEKRFRELKIERKAIDEESRTVELAFSETLFSFQFFTRLAAVFAEEVGGFSIGMI
jgi:hypothetical protein